MKNKYGYPESMEDREAWLTCPAPYRSSGCNGYQKGPHELEFIALKARVKLRPNESRLPQGGYPGKPSPTVTVGMRETAAKLVLDKYSAVSESDTVSPNAYQTPEGIEED